MTWPIAPFRTPSAEPPAVRAAPAATPVVGPWVAVAALTAIVVGAAVLRLWHIDRFGFNSDEAVYAGQGASIAGVPEFSEIFPIFRAHPLLFQLLIAFAYRSGVSDLTPRLMSVGFGLGTVVLAYFLGTLLYGRRAGVFAALVIAVVPYHVLVTRQALLDGPMTFFVTLSLYLLARYGISGRAPALFGAAAAMGLAVNTKESAIIYVAAAYAFFSLTRDVGITWRRAVISLSIVAVVVLPFPVSLLLGGGAETGKGYLVWQLFRSPNHPWTFYGRELPGALGPLLLVAAALGLRESSRPWSWRETLLVSWIVAPLAFFQLWPVKGWQYPLPIAVPVAVFAGAFLARATVSIGVGAVRRVLTAAAILGLVGSLAISSWFRVNATSAGRLLAGTGGVPGGREAGRWIAERTPEGSVMMTVGPSMANLVKFYGHRDAYGISVSPNPLHRNPTYEPVVNPDLRLRNSEIQYIVWDAYSASRSVFFSEKLLNYADLYNGRRVFTYAVPLETASGATVRRPVIVIYEVRPTLRSIEQEQEEE